MQQFFLVRGYYQWGICLIICILSGISVFGQQELIFKGTITDSIANPLPYTNVIITSIHPNGATHFCISDASGKFKITILKDSTYTVEVTHLGFQKTIDTITAQKEITRNYSLVESTTALEAVIIEQKIPMLVKEDTIVYRVDNFVNGKEHKLREVLKKLPGVEVDKLGNVTVNGKKVTKLLVEGNTFFTGDTKLGVNNIPADAVAEIEVLDNYSAISFLKGLSDSDQMALNVKLKEGKKKFVFGDIHAGVGYKDRYLLNPALFYYSKKLTANVIADVNSIGTKSFSMSDYIQFEGGYAEIMDRPQELRNLSGDIMSFLNNEDVTSQKNNFGAASLSAAIGKHTRLEVFSINNNTQETTLFKNSLTYIQSDNIAEDRTTATDKNSVLGLHKIKLIYTPNLNTDFRSTTLIKNSTAEDVEKLISYVADSTITNTQQKPKGITLQQNFTYNKQLSQKHTLSAGLLLNYSTRDKTGNWQFNQPVLNTLIPFEEDGDRYTLVQNQKLSNYTLQTDIKDYWQLSYFHHIYPKVGLSVTTDTYNTEDSQLLTDDSKISFQESGFNNDSKFELSDMYAGIEYKVKIGDLIIKPGITYHNYSWKLWQFNDKQIAKNKAVLLPDFDLEYKISHTENLHLSYEAASNFSSVTKYATRYRLTGFNTLYQGNQDLENELYHVSSAWYSMRDMYRGLLGYLSLRAKNSVRTIRNTVQIDGIEVVNTSIYSNLPDNNYNISGGITKLITKYKFGLNASATFSDFTRIVNAIETDYKTQNYSYTARVISRYNKGFNFELGWKQYFYKLTTKDVENNVTQMNPYGILEYTFLKDFNATFEYQYTSYQNKNYNSTNNFAMGDFAIGYAKEDSLWSFEFAIANVFNTTYKQDINYSDYVVTDSRTYILPRMLLFKVNYKL